MFKSCNIEGKAHTHTHTRACGDITRNPASPDAPHRKRLSRPKGKFERGRGIAGQLLREASRRCDASWTSVSFDSPTLLCTFTRENLTRSPLLAVEMARARFV